MTDSNEVKELEEIIKSYQEDIYNLDPKEMAQAILKADYTKNKGEKVYEGNASIPDIDDMAKWLDKYNEKNIQVFIMEVE